MLSLSAPAHLSLFKPIQTNLRILLAACALWLPGVSHAGAATWGSGTGGVLGRYNSAPGFSL